MMHEVKKLERSNSYLLSCERSGEGDPPGSLPLAGRPHEDDLSFCRIDIARSVTSPRIAMRRRSAADQSGMSPAGTLARQSIR